ncbi:MAG: hypothetical protein JWM16_5186 [Verrucomicrobiales bacterium]|nr:hypothetical protein [Verrucomicrobiales bacterium]
MSVFQGVTANAVLRGKLDFEASIALFDQHLARRLLAGQKLCVLHCFDLPRTIVDWIHDAFAIDQPLSAHSRGYKETDVRIFRCYVCLPSVRICVIHKTTS